jgi:hypothetical protein
MESGDMAEFMSRMLVREGAWIIEPTRGHNDSYLVGMLNRLRHVPSRISNPPGTSKFRFAERGAEGRWFFVWVEDR